MRASTWLETHGKKDVWKLYAHDQAEVLPADRRATPRKQAVKDMLKLSKTVADTLGTRYQQSAPYVLHPSLRPDHVVTPGPGLPVLLPLAARGGGRRGHDVPLRPSTRTGPREYRWMQAEIDYSRVYMAGPRTSDVTGGALLGDLIGEYFSVTRR